MFLRRRRFGRTDCINTKPVKTQVNVNILTIYYVDEKRVWISENRVAFKNSCITGIVFALFMKLVLSHWVFSDDIVPCNIIFPFLNFLF